VFVAAAGVAIVMLVRMIPVDVSQVVEVLREPGPGESSKLTMFKLTGEGLGADDRYSLASILLGFTLIGLGAYGTDQDMTQRMLTCRSAKSGMASMRLPSRSSLSPMSDHKCRLSGTFGSSSEWSRA